MMGMVAPLFVFLFFLLFFCFGIPFLTREDWSSYQYLTTGKPEDKFVVRISGDKCMFTVGDQPTNHFNRPSNLRSLLPRDQTRREKKRREKK